MLALEGKQLGNYDIIRRIRVGGMGAVYEGKQRTAFGRRVAIKVILGNYAADPDMRRRFEREARTVARLHHPHILPLIEFGEKQGLLYLVMPFIDGGTLTAFLSRTLPDLSEVTAIYLQLLEAVEYAHDEGLIHRDIKSSNVLLESRRKRPPYVYLADFGLVRMAGTSQRTHLGQEGKSIPLDQVPGTPYYMAPEQTRGIVTVATDIYALGVLLYQMLVGGLPYDDPDEIKVIQMHLYEPVPSPCDRDASIPVELGEVVRTAMAKRAEDRFRSVAELRSAFLAATENPSLEIDHEDLHPIDKPESQPISLPLVSEQVPLAVPPRRRLPSQRMAAPSRMKRRPGGPKRAKRRRFTLTIAAMVVPLVLLILLLMPRVLGLSFFPSGFPLFGTAPIATVTVTAQSKMLQNTYLLTASPQTKSPDLATRILPARNVSAVVTNTRSATSTGTTLLPGKQASGSIRFQNGGATTISLPVGMIFTTTSGVQIQLTQSVTVPPDGSVSASAIAVNPGLSGNIPSQALATLCCRAGVIVSNPQPFTGGVDAHLVHVVAHADLDRVRDALSQGLQQQAVQQLQKQLQVNEVIAGKPAYKIIVSSNYPVGAQVDQVQVQVSVSVTAYVYNLYTAKHIAVQLLNNEAIQTLGNNFQSQGMPVVATPRVVQQAQNGLVYLSVSAHGRWVYAFSTQQLAQWRQSIKGATSTLALAYLNTQPGVLSAYIQLPFGTDHLPSSVDQIKVVLMD
ncbi:MAG TPA: protein kinase [Ktedonobacteraceae bacterium]|nr:protein kinase [Ktedonobacteraceae bacterium]